VSWLSIDGSDSVVDVIDVVDVVGVVVFSSIEGGGSVAAILAKEAFAGGGGM
jgi:hypothetical protein